MTPPCPQGRSLSHPPPTHTRGYLTLFVNNICIFFRGGSSVLWACQVMRIGLHLGVVLQSLATPDSTERPDSLLKQKADISGNSAFFKTIHEKGKIKLKPGYISRGCDQYRVSVQRLEDEEISRKRGYVVGDIMCFVDHPGVWGT